METIQEYYNRVRDEITDGCLFLISKDAIVSKAIRWADSRNRVDKADKSHIGILWIEYVDGIKRIMTLESNEDGLQKHYFSDVLKECDSLVIIKSLIDKTIICNNLSNVFLKAEKGVKYDFFNGFKELINRAFNLNLKITGKADIEICSKAVKGFSISSSFINLRLEINGKKFEDLSLPFPMDYLRYRNIANTKLL